MAILASSDVSQVASGASATLPWYALRVVPTQERVVASALAAHGIEGFLPTYTVEVRWSDRTKTITRPLFSGYLFGAFDPAEGLPVLAIPGVVHVLPSNLHPVAVVDAEIDVLKRICSFGLALRPCRLALGELVTITSGALTGATGVIVRFKDQLRLVVSVQMFQRAISIELDAESVASCR